MGDVVADAGERVDHRLHLVEHAVDDPGQPREWIVRSALREPLAQLAGHDALDPLVHLLHASLGADAQPGASQQTEAEGRQQAQGQRLPHHARYLARLIDVPSHHQDIAAIETSADRPDDRNVGCRLFEQVEPHALHRAIKPQLARQMVDVAGQPRASGIEQSRVLHAPGILPEMIRDRADAAGRRQVCDEVNPCGDHAIGSRDQIVVELPVDEREQADHEQREGGRHGQGPEERAGADQLALVHLAPL